MDVDWPPVVVRDGELETAVIYRDTFGNLKLGALADDLRRTLAELAYGEPLIVRLGRGTRARRVPMPWAPTFGQVDTAGFLLYEDSYGRLCIAQNRGNAAESLALDEGTLVRVARDRGSQATG